jgi:copper chaperone NosL
MIIQQAQLHPKLKSMKNRMGTISRIVLVVCALALVAVLFVPMWRIELSAPQYPEGLKLLIYPNRLGGNVDIINGLNHYIGMKTLHTADFIEFTVLPYIIIFFVAAFGLAALLGRRKWLNILLILFVCFGVIAMVDFWRWEYNYGHNLNPNAAIIVPGMAYQPPLIGYKQLLNFGAYAIPDIGGWIFAGAGAILLSLVVVEWRAWRIIKRNRMRIKPVDAIICLVLLSSCKTSPEPLKIGKDNCSFCKMTISDDRYGAEIITRKGKVYKFDDSHCLMSFIDSKTIEKKEIDKVYFTDFMNGHALIQADDAFLLQSDFFRGPMNGDLAAFSNKDSMNLIAQQYKANVVSWKQLIQ